MEREISKEQYAIEAVNNPNCLDYPKVTEQGVIFENNLMLCVKNKFKYKTYQGQKVKYHYLIITKRNDVFQFYDLKSQEDKALRHILKTLKPIFDKKGQGITYTIKETGKSIQKFHMHYLVLETER
jgi:hypothetical protein